MLSSHLKIFTLLVCTLSMGCATRIATLQRAPQNSTVVLNPQSFTSAWAFDATDTASYSYNTNSVNFTSGVSRLTGADQVDNDNTSSGFAGGTLSGAAWDATNSYVRLSQTGTPTNTSKLDSSWAPRWSNTVGVWHLDEALGTAGAASIIDASGLGNHGTPTNTTFGATGLLSTAATFNGTTSIVSVPDANNLDLTTAGTVAFWIKNSSSAGYQFPVSKNGSVDSTMPYSVQLDPAGNQMYCYLGNNTTSQALTSGMILPLNTWYHFACVWDATTLYVFLNGRLINSAARTVTPFNNTGSVDIGGSVTRGYPLNGTLDEVAIWNTGLTANEIARIYDRQTAKYSGTVLSRVMDAFATGMSWTTLSWAPTLPFAKELPTTSETVAAYSSMIDSSGSSANSSLNTGLVALWHLDEASGAPTAVDSVSIPHNGARAAGSTFGKPGRFGNAAAFNGTSTGYINMGDNLYYWKDDPVTYSAWFNTTSSGGNACLICKTYGNGNGVQLSMNAGRVYAAFFSTAANKQVTTTATFNDGRWHNVAYTYDASNTAAGMKIYIDGVLQAVTVNSDGALGVQANPEPFQLGGYDLGSGNFYTGLIDEVGVWTRVLHPNEIKALYRRGGNRVKYQVRVCTAANCSDDATGANWKGPDGTNQTYFSEMNNNSAPLLQTGTVGVAAPSMLFSAFTSPVGTSRYFQYRTILESDDASTNCNYGSGATWCSPEVKSVTVDPVHYDSANATVVSKTGVSFVSVATFTETLGAACPSGIGYNLGVGSTYSSATWYWWSGAAWVVANGTAAESNAATAVNTNAAAFAGTVGTGTVYFKAFLKSTGTSQCELDNLALGGIQLQ